MRLRNTSVDPRRCLSLPLIASVGPFDVPGRVKNTRTSAARRFRVRPNRLSSTGPVGRFIVRSSTTDCKSFLPSLPSLVRLALTIDGRGDFGGGEVGVGEETYDPLLLLGREQISTGVQRPARPIQRVPRSSAMPGGLLLHATAYIVEGITASVTTWNGSMTSTATSSSST